MADVLTIHEAQTIVAAMSALRAIGARATATAIDERDTLGVSDTISYGRLAESCDTARDVLFGVLNCASSFLSSEAAKDAIEQDRASRGH